MFEVIFPSSREVNSLFFCHNLSVRMIRVLILATVIPAILATQGLLRCNSGHEMPTRTTVLGCDSTPCNVQLGQSAQMEIIFTARKYFHMKWFIIIPLTANNFLWVEKKSLTLLWIPFLIRLLAREIVTLTPVATAFLLGIGINYELPPEILRGCDHIVDASCPIPAGTTVTYNFELPVSANYPAVRNMPVEVALQDSQGTFSCVRVTITAVRG